METHKITLPGLHEQTTDIKDRKGATGGFDLTGDSLQGTGLRQQSRDPAWQRVRRRTVIKAALKRRTATVTSGTWTTISLRTRTARATVTRRTRTTISFWPGATRTIRTRAAVTLRPGTTRAIRTRTTGISTRRTTRAGASAVTTRTTAIVPSRATTLVTPSTTVKTTAFTLRPGSAAGLVFAPHHLPCTLGRFQLFSPYRHKLQLLQIGQVYRFRRVHGKILRNEKAAIWPQEGSREYRAAFAMQCEFFKGNTTRLRRPE